MPADERAVRAETLALDALIDRAVSQVCHGADKGAPDALLFLGNWHEAFPVLVVQDPVLEPVDKVVWMVIGASARAAGTHTAFPSYAEIARRANVASTSTVSRSVAILRATRWLSLCARVRDVGGRFRGNVYALHDEPLPLADALYLDPGYMQALRAARTHHHARVRRVVDAVLESIDEDIGEGRDVLAPESALERRLEAHRAVHGGESRRYFTFSAAVLSRLASRVPHAPSIDRDQKSKAVPHRLRNSSPQNSKAVRSSTYIYKTTTTTTPSSAAQNSKAAVVHATLVYPERLSANQRGLAARYLASIPGEHRQGVLDELEGRLQAERQGAKAV